MSENQTIAMNVRDNLELVMGYHQWHNRDVFAKLHPYRVADSTFVGWKAEGTSDAEAIAALAKAVGWPFHVMAGLATCPERDEMIASRIWNPISSKGAAEFATAVRDHLGKGKRVISLMQEVPCSWMTERVINRMYDKYFAPVESTQYGRELKKQYKRFGQQQRKRFCDPTIQNPKNMLAIIPRSDFEKLIRSSRPFDGCRTQDILECLSDMREHCVLGGISFLLVDTPTVNEIPEVRAAYSKVDSVVAVDDSFTFRREIESIGGQLFPRLLRWSADPSEVAKAKNIVSKYLKPSGFDYQAETLRELDNYEKVLEG